MKFIKNDKWQWYIFEKITKKKSQKENPNSYFAAKSAKSAYILVVSVSPNSYAHRVR